VKIAARSKPNPRLIHTHCYGLEARDLEAVAAFVEDAIWHISEKQALHGKAERLAWLRQNTPVYAAHL